MRGVIFKTRFFDDAELQQVAMLHVTGIQNGFLSSLGAPFLKTIYAEIGHNDAGALIIASQEGKVIGFASGAVSVRPIFSGLLKKNFLMGALILLPKLLSPKHLRRILELAAYPHRDTEKKGEAAAELLSIVVANPYRGQGLAQVLFNNLVAEFKNRNIKKFRIVVGSELLAAQKFYEKMGAVKRRPIEVHAGEKSFEYTYEQQV